MPRPEAFDARRGRASDLWPEPVDEILASDQVVALGYVTPARGVVLNPLTNFGIRNRAQGTVSPLCSSIGMWKKLKRLQASPQIAVAYHTRHLSFTDRPEYVLVQGRAELSPLDDKGWIDRHRQQWERFAGPRDVGPLWEPWLRVYHWRVGITIAVERLLVWPDLRGQGELITHGMPPSADPPAAQSAPKNGTAPRVNHRRAAKRLASLPHVLLSWVGSDGHPLIVPVEIADTSDHGIKLLDLAGLVPAGGRRAGLVAHTFARYTYGQNQRKHTGWLEADGRGEIVYAPHTESGYHLPPSRFLYRLSAGLMTRRGLGEARKAGFVPEGR